MANFQRGREVKVYPQFQDRGKKHFWNNSNKDYGVYDSLTPYQNEQNTQRQLENTNRRYSTVDIYQNPSQYYATQRSLDKIGLRNKSVLHNYDEGRNMNLISNNISVQLPPLKKLEKVQPTLPKEKNNHLSLNPKTLNQSLNIDNGISRQNKNQIQKRVETQPNPESYNYSFQDKGRRKTRYSPTYVCSFTNPMPTFKLYNGNPRQPVYEYGFSAQR